MGASRARGVAELRDLGKRLSGRGSSVSIKRRCRAFVLDPSPWQRGKLPYPRPLCFESVGVVKQGFQVRTIHSQRPPKEKTHRRLIFDQCSSEVLAKPFEIAFSVLIGPEVPASDAPCCITVLLAKRAGSVWMVAYLIDHRLSFRLVWESTAVVSEKLKLYCGRQSKKTR